MSAPQAPCCPCSTGSDSQNIPCNPCKMNVPKKKKKKNVPRPHWVRNLGWVFFAAQVKESLTRKNSSSFR